MAKDEKKILGCLLGGAAGDALGYAIEFDSEKVIFKEYGKTGIREYELYGGKVSELVPELIVALRCGG